LGSQMSAATIFFRVRVPVLSLQMSVTVPEGGEEGGREGGRVSIGGSRCQQPHLFQSEGAGLSTANVSHRA
jgi:hypothetical protein